MIVDDVEEIRKGIKLKADWCELGFDICSEAQNGREALELLTHQSIDLVITDIHMPIMNGLDLLRECSSSYPDMKLVVLSGYDDFQYVKTALQCGAIDYLLKPVVVDELEELLKKVKTIMDEEFLQRETESSIEHQLNNHKALLQEQFILQLAKEDTRSIPEMIERAGFLNLQHLITNHMHAFIITVQMRVPEGRYNESPLRPDLLRTAFQLICREIAGPYKQNAIVFYDMNHPSMMHFFLKTQPDLDSAAEPKRFSSTLQQKIAHYLHLETVIGIGHLITSPAEMKKGYASALLAWSQSRLSQNSQIVQADHLHENVMVPEDLEIKMALSLERGESGLFEDTVKEWLSLREQHSMYSYYLAVMKMFLLFDSVTRKYHLEQAPFQELMWSMNHTLWKFDSNENNMDRVLHIGYLIMEGIRRTKASSGEEIVNAICLYIEENYSYELSLAGLAERFHINAAYLSDLFHRQTGKTYSQYLFDTRMKHAELLLKDDHLRIGDIASLVGFSNAGYFGTIFKKQFRISPSEYRESKKNNI